MGRSCCSLRSTRIWVCMWGFSIQAVLLPCAVSRTALFGFLRNLLSLGCVNIWVISFTVLLCFKKEDESRLQNTFFCSFFPLLVTESSLCGTATQGSPLSWTMWEGRQTWDNVYLDSLQLISVTHVVKHSFKAGFQKPCSTWRVGATAGL